MPTAMWFKEPSKVEVAPAGKGAEKPAAAGAHDALAHPEGQIEPEKARIALFEEGDDTQRMQVVVEAQTVAAHGLVERPLPGVPEGGMTHVVAQTNRLGEILVQRERPRDTGGP